MNDNFDNQAKKTIDLKNINIHPKLIISVIVILFLLVGLSSSIFIVREDEVAVVRKLGAITRVIIGSDNAIADAQNL